MDRKTRQKKVHELHLLGWSQRRIADHLNLSLGTVKRLLKNTLVSRNCPIYQLLKRKDIPCIGLELKPDHMKRYLEVCKIGRYDNT